MKLSKFGPTNHLSLSVRDPKMKKAEHIAPPFLTTLYQGLVFTPDGTAASLDEVLNADLAKA